MSTHWRRVLLTSVIVLAGALFAGGCARMYDPEASHEYHDQVIATVAPGQVLGQTFVPRRPNVNGINLWLRVAEGSENENGQAVFELFASQGRTHPLVRLPLNHAAIRTSLPTRLVFPTIEVNSGQNLYWQVSAVSGVLQVLGRNEDSYPGGAATLAGAPLQADAGFQLTYEYDRQAFLADIRASANWLWVLLPLAGVLLLPGWILLRLLRLNRFFDWGERLAMAFGLSLAVAPIVMTWSSALGWRWSREWVLAGSGALLLLGATLAIKDVMAMRRPEPDAPSFPPTTPHLSRPLSPANILLALIFLGALAVRLIMVRDLAGPPWVDSVHHAAITRLILLQGRFPESYAPLIDIETDKYHAGFHSAVAFFQWLSGMELPQSMLLLGQVLNALVIFSVYLFTRRLAGNRLAGVFAAAITAFFTPMPAYLTSWGRYTQLAGIAILPAAFAGLQLALDGTNPVAARHRLGASLAAAIALAGLAMTHYRVAAFLACLLLAVGGLHAPAWLRGGQRRRRSSLLIARLAIVGLAALLLVSPWLPATLSTLVVPLLPPPQTPPRLFADFTWGYLTSGYGLHALILAGVGLALGVVFRRRFALLLLVWVGLMFLAANLSALGLLGASFFNNTSVEITLFMPISVLGGYALAQGAALLSRLRFRSVRLGLQAAALIVGVYLCWSGGVRMLPSLNPVTFLLRRADLPAMGWIEENVPADEAFLINPFLWGYGLYAGQDGGYWISPLTGHKTYPPPVLYGLTTQRDSIDKLVNLSEQVLQAPLDSQRLHTLMQANRIGYVYIGARGGALSARALSADPAFRLVYQKDAVWIYKALFLR